MENQSTKNKYMKGIAIAVIFTLLIGANAAVIIPALVGQTPQSPVSISILFWNSVLILLLWKTIGKKLFSGFMLGLILGLSILFGSSALAGYMKVKNNTPESFYEMLPEWKQTELTVDYMKTLTKDECLQKTVASLKTCDSDNCLKNLAGVTGDCVSFSAGDRKEFCDSYDEKYMQIYCHSGELSYRGCKLLEVIDETLCR